MGTKGPWTLPLNVAKEPGMLWPPAHLIGPIGCLSQQYRLKERSEGAAVTSAYCETKDLSWNPSSQVKTLKPDLCH